MKKSAFIALIIFIGWIGLSILQLWGGIVDLDTYWKITVTAILAIVAIIISGLIYREYLEENQMKKDGYID